MKSFGKPSEVLGNVQILSNVCLRKTSKLIEKSSKINAGAVKFLGRHPVILESHLKLLVVTSTKFWTNVQNLVTFKILGLMAKSLRRTV